MSNAVSRRTMLKQSLMITLGTYAAITAKNAAVAAPTPLDPADASAKALGFVLDASTGEEARRLSCADRGQIRFDACCPSVPACASHGGASVYNRSGSLPPTNQQDGERHA